MSKQTKIKGICLVASSREYVLKWSDLCLKYQVEFYWISNPYELYTYEPSENIDLFLVDDQFGKTSATPLGYLIDIREMFDCKTVLFSAELETSFNNAKKLVDYVFLKPQVCLKALADLIQTK